MPDFVMSSPASDMGTNCYPLSHPDHALLSISSLSKNDRRGLPVLATCAVGAIGMKDEDRKGGLLLLSNGQEDGEDGGEHACRP